MENELKELSLKIDKRFNAKVDKPDNFLQSDYIVGFEYSNVPVILNNTPEIIAANYHRSLLPSWSQIKQTIQT